MITPFLPSSAPDAPTRFDIFDSPVGQILLTGDDRALTGLFMMDKGGHPQPVGPDWIRGAGACSAAADQLEEYFAGKRTEFDLPLAPRGTDFQRSVWTELARIPFGETTSYGEIALSIGKSLLASRAVGLANGRNPISVILPCHRVIGADGSLTGYGGGLPRKEWLLRHEGVRHEGAVWGPAANADEAQTTLF
jgi:methylated-DNA-[protein]-cysteine S-methyltransferase